MKYSSRRLFELCFVLSTAFFALNQSCELNAADWPMWRCDGGRTNRTVEPMPGERHLQWKRQLPVVEPAFRKKRLQFDQGYEPIVAQNTMFVALPHVDAVVAYAADSGQERWCFYAEGPIRFAPVYWKNNVYFGADDGHLYCVDADNGELKWKFRAVPSHRKILGNGRMISVWPLRGGPVIADGVVYFAAGVWPMEGIFVYAVDAATGDVVWVNDRTGSVYGDTPHGGKAFAGLTPQGYLLVNADELVVPCGTARPATFNRHTGDVIEFSLPKERNNPGGWFMTTDTQDARDIRRGKLQFDSNINNERHEGKPHTGPGIPGVRSRLLADGRDYDYADDIAGVEGTIHSLLVADGRLFVVTLEGAIYAFAAEKTQPLTYDSSVVTKDREPLSQVVLDYLQKANSSSGYALVLGTTQGMMAEQLADHSSHNVLAIVADEDTCEVLRSRSRAAGVKNDRLACVHGHLTEAELPPYFADLIVVEDLLETEFVSDQKQFLKAVFERLRPYGGVACLPVAAEHDDEIEVCLREMDCAQAVLKRDGNVLTIRREGALPGAVDYDKNWTAADDLVRAPLGILWFDDSIPHFKRAPQPQIREGIMVSQDKNWLEPPISAAKTGHYHEDGSARFKVSENRYADVYTGRVMSSQEATARLTVAPAPAERSARFAYNYRPPFVSAHVADLKAKGRKLPSLPFLQHVDKGKMINPMTGVKESRRFVKSYGCDGGNDYGHMITMRSATPAFYDKRIESGTINISGPRSGCTNSVIPANGVLNVPFFYDGCSCNYPLPTGAGLINMPQSFEQWTAWGDGKPGPIIRLGVNLGAPGDRMTNEGTLFLDHPSVGGPSPKVSISTQPATPDYFYHHAVFTEGGKGWPWVCGSGVTGITSLEIAGLKKGTFTVRLYFLEPEHTEKGRRVFDVTVQKNHTLNRYDILADTGGRMQCAVKEFREVQVDERCRITLTAHVGAPLLSGVELVASDLTLDSIVARSDQ